MKNHKELIFGFIFLILACVLLNSCVSNMKIVESKKEKHISGLANGKNYVDYTIKIDSKVNFSFESLVLNDIKINKNIYIKNLSTGLTSTKINSNIKKGIYLFGFRVYNTNAFTQNETITFNCLINNIKISIKEKINSKNKVKTNR